MKDWKEYKPDRFEMRNGYVQNWFSNMVVSPIEIDGITYNSVENYFQSHKSLHPDDWRRIAVLAPNKSKREGRKLMLRVDWEDVKYDVMLVGLRVKFALPEWRDKLLATGDETIIEWNNWNDNIWGVPISSCIGYNLLGKALMQVRKEIKKEIQ